MESILPADHKNTWLTRIIGALVEKGHLFNLQTVTGSDYGIQG